MANTFQVLDFLTDPPRSVPAGGVCALHGKERYLQKLALDQWLTLLRGEAEGESDFGVERLRGGQVDWAELHDALSTHSLFAAAGPTVVVLDDADAFLNVDTRPQLEALLGQDLSGSWLVLLLPHLDTRTRLAKLIEKKGCSIDCELPTQGKGRNAVVDETRVARWLVHRAKAVHGFELTVAQARELFQLTQQNPGWSDQELGKLVLFTDDRGRLTDGQVAELVGGWAEKTMWDVVDRAADGDAAEALRLIQKLVQAKNHPLAMFGQIAWSLRRYAEVGEVVDRERRAGKRFHQGSQDALLRAAGFFNPREYTAVKGRLKQLGPGRVRALYDCLLETDLKLKWTHSQDERGQLALEMLLVGLSRELGETPVGPR